MVDVVDDGLVQDLELAAENALARVAELEKRVAELETENGLRCAQLAMLGSEVCGDPKLDPDDSGDPRWTPALREARALRERAQRAEARVAELERRQPYHALVFRAGTNNDVVRSRR